MFNKTVVGGSYHTHSHRSTVNVTEKRAPTDESVRLLDEMKAKALDSIADGFLANNEVRFVAFELGPVTGFATRTLIYAFRLNGQLYRAEFEMDHRELFDPEAVVKKVTERLGNAIASLLFPRSIEGLVQWSKQP